MITEDERDSRQEAERDCDAEALENEFATLHPAWSHGLLIGQSGAAVVSELPTV